MLEKEDIIFYLTSETYVGFGYMHIENHLFVAILKFNIARKKSALHKVKSATDVAEDENEN